MTGFAADLRTVAAEIAALHQVDVDDVLADSRGPDEVAAARQHLMWLLRDCGLSYPHIGRLLGRDHTTVAHGVRVWAQRESLPVRREVVRDPAAGCVDAGRVRAHVVGLCEAGMSVAEVAAAASVGRSTVQRVVSGGRVRVLPGTAVRLLAVSPPPPPVCVDCGGRSLAGGRWCGVGRCQSRRWSWSQKVVAARASERRSARSGGPTGSRYFVERDV